jgi:hypothetical protein
MKESVTQTSNGSRCRGRNRAGLPCARRASRNDYCTVHDPERPRDMRELGRRGGRRSPIEKLRVAADDSLREKARKRLEQVLEGDDEAAALRAATALYSYRAESSSGS